jgi:hypothetical protein
MPLRSEKGSLETKSSDLSILNLKSLSRVNSPIFTENAIRQQSHETGGKWQLDQRSSSLSERSKR